MLCFPVFKSFARTETEQPTKQVFWEAPTRVFETLVLFLFLLPRLSRTLRRQLKY